MSGPEPEPDWSEFGRFRPPPDRNDEIRRRVAAGETQADLAREFGITRKRVSQIVHHEHFKAKQRRQKRAKYEREHHGPPG